MIQFPQSLIDRSLPEQLDSASQGSLGGCGSGLLRTQLQDDCISQARVDQSGQGSLFHRVNQFSQWLRKMIEFNLSQVPS